MLIMPLSWNCNLDCRYCIIDKSKTKVISIDKAKKAIDLYTNYYNKEYPNDFISIYFYGGEPFLNKKLIFNLTEYAKQKGKPLEIILTTNLTILDKEIINYIKKYNINLSISLDGTKATNDANRKFKNGQGSFDTIIKNLTLLNENGIYPVVSFVYDPNIKNLLENLKFVLSLGITEISFKPIMGSITSENFKEVLNDFNTAADWYIQELKNRRFPKLKQFFSGVKQVYKSKTEKNNQRICSAGTRDLFISPEGKIYPCNEFFFQNQYDFGSVDNYRSDKHYFFRNFIAKFGSERKLCISCPFNGFCEGSCMSSNLKKNGKIFEVNNDDFYLYSIINLMSLKIYNAIKDDREILLSITKF